MLSVSAIIAITATIIIISIIIAVANKTTAINTICSTGQYKSGNNCINCPSNSYSISGLGCKCNPGYIKDQSGAGCIICPAGKYQSGNNCLDCPRHNSVAGATSCCNPGYFQNLDYTCSTCPNNNTYQFFNGCALCEDNSHVVTGSTVCTCDPGYIVDPIWSKEGSAPFCIPE